MKKDIKCIFENKKFVMLDQFLTMKIIAKVQTKNNKIFSLKFIYDLNPQVQRNVATISQTMFEGVIKNEN